MNKTSKFNDIIFIIVIVFHLYRRQWPWGDSWQTALDVVFTATGILIAVKYYWLFYKRR